MAQNILSVKNENTYFQTFCFTMALKNHVILYASMLITILSHLKLLSHMLNDHLSVSNRCE